MNTTTRRFPRSERDVWPWHGVVTHYRAPARWLLPLGYVCLFGLFAGLGVLLAWRG